MLFKYTIIYKKPQKKSGEWAKTFAIEDIIEALTYYDATRKSNELWAKHCALIPELSLESMVSATIGKLES